MHDALGDRMKRNYEDPYRIYLPRRTNLIIRVDGKSFHNYTKFCERPFDPDLHLAMSGATHATFQDLQGIKVAFTSSDEASFLLTDYDTLQSEPAYGNNLQKLCSLTAAMMSVYFYAMRTEQAHPAPAFFDARVFIISDPEEVVNYFVWRQKDCLRNAINLLGQAHFSHRQLQGLNKQQVIDKLYHELGIDFWQMPPAFKNGTVILRTPDKDVVSSDIVFSQDRSTITDLLPGYNKVHASV